MDWRTTPRKAPLAFSVRSRQLGWRLARPQLAGQAPHLVRVLIDRGNEISEDEGNFANIEADDADLVILEGMGRGVESNLKASFTCDAVKLAMLKDEAVARRCGGKLFDVVCRFRAAGD